MTLLDLLWAEQSSVLQRFRRRKYIVPYIKRFNEVAPGLYENIKAMISKEHLPLVEHFLNDLRLAVVECNTRLPDSVGDLAQKILDAPHDLMLLITDLSPRTELAAVAPRKG
jgi:hypothetical protein